MSGEEVEHFVLRDRQKIAKDGVVVVLAEVDSSTGEIINTPTIVACHSINIDYKYCNLRNVKLDSIITLSTSFNRKMFFKEKGKYNIRGFIEEHNNLAINNPKNYKIRHVYYNLLLNVE
jgi:mRNA degradation ribonuclease J1/J2